MARRAEITIRRNVLQHHHDLHELEMWVQLRELMRAFVRVWVARVRQANRVNTLHVAAIYETMILSYNPHLFSLPLVFASLCVCVTQTMV